MKRYKVIIPEYALEIVATNKAEALDLFWHEFDCDERSNRDRPIIKIIKQ